jgi:hypothetical protein
MRLVRRQSGARDDAREASSRLHACEEIDVQQDAIFGPIFATIGLTFCVWVYMYVKRIAFIRGQGLTPEEMAIPGRLAELSPPDVSNPSDNFKNLFEMPVIFYALALALYASGRVDLTYLTAAWVFVAFRVLHSIMHCTANVVMVRFNLYLVSSLAVWFMAGRAALQFLGS